MKFYKSDENKITCLLCSHHCKLKPNKIGMCGVNQNVNGELKTLVYGYIAAFNVDPVEKKPLYHFLPNTKILSLGTVGCNFRCPFCQNWGISQHNNIDKSKYTSPKEVVQIAIKKGCKSIAYTYNEPTIFYPYIRDIAIEAKKFGLRSVMVTNGFESKEVIEDMKDTIDAVNVDLKSFDRDYYKKVLKGDLDIQLKNLVQMKKNGIWIEVTTLVIPTKNDSKEELSKIAEFIANDLGVDTPWHISAFHPDFKEQDLPRTPTKSLLLAQEIGQKAGLKHVYVGNAGLNNSNHCKECNEEVISRVTYKIHKDVRKDEEFCPKCHAKLDGIYKEIKMSTRVASRSGSFYPNNKTEVLNLFEKFNNILSQSNFTFLPNKKPKAIIVPHAGYIYSGFTANVAYSLLKDEYEKVVVIGPSHHVGFEGLSVGEFEDVQTPLGSIEVDKEFSRKISESPLAVFEQKAHQLEHSTETQFSFIKHYLPSAKIIELIYGKIEYKQIANLISKLINDKTLVVVSTDLSHFYDLQKAKQLDSICLESIDKQDNEVFSKGCEACGRVGVKAMNIVAKNMGLKTKLLDYRTSFDASKDDKRVVGYTSAVIF